MRSVYTEGIIVGAVFAWLTSSMIAQQSPPLLDLTRVPQDARAVSAPGQGSSIDVGKPEEVRGGVGSGVRIEKLPLAIGLMSINPNPCVWGEHVTYEVDVTNRGPNALILPWSTSGESVVSTSELARNYRELAVALVMDDRTETGTLLGPVSAAFGSDAAPGTTRTLAKADSIRIRALAVCRPERASSHESGLHGTLNPVSVYVRLALRTHPRVVGRSVTSSPLKLTILAK